MPREMIFESENDPWTRKRQKSPPGLDEIISSIFGGRKGKGGKANKISFLFALILVGVVFLASGFFIVAPAEQAVILRFGQFVRVLGPGPNWIVPGVEQRKIVNVHKIFPYNYSAEMLTRDENYADVDVTVFYRITNPKNFLFSAVDPVNSLAQATASALRQVVGDTSLEPILTVGRAEARDKIHKQIEAVVRYYDIGIEITDTKLQDAKPPQAVKSAFDNVIQAREDFDRYKKQAEAYQNTVVPKAEGSRMRIENEALAEHERIILDAHEQVAGFNALLSQYFKNPQIIRNKLFLTTMKDMYGRVKKVFVTGDGNLSLLPLGELLKPAGDTSTAVPGEMYEK